MQVDYTPPVCNLPWGTVTVTPKNPAPFDATTNPSTDYTITTSLPNVSGCSLKVGSVITITFGDPETDASGTTMFDFITPTATLTSLGTTSHSKSTVTFTITNAMLAGTTTATACGGAPCLQENTPITIVLHKVKNPTTQK
ncbi:MAG TPA: hypothetical protein VMT89_08195, partial [Candidatus Acidoferrales bacterium]|nr:hypothetical protein [Candidatus Acidoferrales bacterium]